MAKKVLNIIATAYRATLEEQDDTIVWLTHALRGAGADLDVLLRGNAVNYAVKGQDASGLAFGGRRQTQPPRIGDDVAKLITKGVRVFFVEEDLTERGVERADLIPAVEPVTHGDLPKLLAAYDQVWHW
jgi:sulfur transfer complex TusBCD TusB component (DsrH family)